MSKFFVFAVVSLSMVFLHGCADSPSAPAPPILVWTDAGTVPGDGFYDAIWIDDRLYAVDHKGGLSVFDPALGGWETLPSLPIPREDAVLAAARGKLLVIGGETADEVIVDTVEEFDPVSGGWRSRAPLPVAVCMTAAVTVDGVVYVIGGDSRGGPSAAVQRYEPAADAWDLGTAMPTGRCVLSLARAGNRIYALGGITLGTTKDSWIWLRTAEAYDPAADAWIALPDMPEPRADHTAIAWGDELLVIGGITHTEHGGDPASGDVLAFHPASGTWDHAPAMRHPRYGHGAAVRNGAVYIVGGRLDIDTPEPVMEVGALR